jgi:hypothetical protein
MLETKVLDDQIKTILINFFHQNEEELQCIWIGGSFSVPYITNPHDVDIILVWKHRYYDRERIKKCRTLSRQIHDLDGSYQIIFRYNEKYDESFIDHWPIYAYLYKYRQNLIGTLYPVIDQFDILQYEERMWKTLIQWKEKQHSKKGLYHILTTLYILLNQSYDLTEEQITNINIAHDQQDLEKIKILYQWALQQIEE